MATLRVLGGEGQRAARVTEALGIAPTSVSEVGEVVGPRGPRLRTRGLWMLSSSTHPEMDVELDASLRLLLDRLEPAAEQLWALAHEGYTMTWWCYLGSHAAEHAAQLDRLTLTRLLSVPGELWLDVYPEDGDG